MAYIAGWLSKSVRRLAPLVLALVATSAIGLTLDQRAAFKAQIDAQIDALRST
jgi:hypothetical protein